MRERLPVSMTTKIASRIASLTSSKDAAIAGHFGCFRLKVRNTRQS